MWWERERSKARKIYCSNAQCTCDISMSLVDRQTQYQLYYFHSVYYFQKFADHPLEIITRVDCKSKTLHRVDTT